MADENAQDNATPTNGQPAPGVTPDGHTDGPHPTPEGTPENVSDGTTPEVVDEPKVTEPPASDGSGVQTSDDLRG